MAFNIDDLEIQIVAKSINAIEQLSKLSRSLRTLSKIELDSSKITDFINDIAELGEQGESLKIVAVELNEIARALNKFKVPKEVTSMAQNIRTSFDPQDIMFAEDAPSLSKAGKGVDAFIESITRLNDVGKDVTGLNNIANALASIAQSSSQLKRVSIQLREVSTSSHQASGGISSLLSSFGRIVKYRIIRYILRKTVEYIKEGVQWFVEWDKTANNSMAGAANAVEKLKLSLNNLKGQLGAAFGTLLGTVQPILTWLINAFTEVINLIQKVIRALQGHSDYYKYVAGSMNEAAGAAKALKEALFGFDELNVLPSASGVGVSNQSGSGEYVLEPIWKPAEEGSFQDWIDKNISEPFQTWWDNEFAPFFTEKIPGFFAGIQPWIDENISEPLEKWVNTKFKPFFTKTIPQFFRSIQPWIDKNISEPIQTWWDGEVVPWFTKKWNDLWSGIGQFFISTVPNWWKQHITDPITRFLTKVIGNIRTFIDNVIMAIGEVVYFITHPLTDSWSDMCARIKSQWKTFTLETEKTSDEMKTKVVKDFNEMSQEGGNSGLKLQKEWALTAEEAKKKAEEAKKNVNKTVEDLVSEIVDEVGTLEKRLKPPKLELTFKVNANGVPEQISKAWGEIQKNLRTTPIYFSLSSASNVTEDYVNDSKQKLRNMTLLANGGSPDIGTLFWAGEAGAEVVANTSHGTGVMNVSQMQEAVANGNIEVVNAVYAMANMVVNAVNTKDFDVYMDASKVGQSVSKWQFNQARRGITQGAY